MGRVVSCFPEIGRHAYLNAKPETTKNLSMTEYSTIAEGNVIKRNPKFPANYIDAIKSNMGLYDVILVDSSAIVRDHLKKKKIPYTVVYPATDPETIKDFRIRLAHSSLPIAGVIRDNLTGFISEIRRDPFPTKIELHSGKYLIDVL